MGRDLRVQASKEEVGLVQQSTVSPLHGPVLKSHGLFHQHAKDCLGRNPHKTRVTPEVVKVLKNWFKVRLAFRFD
jgi:hypothetical protein